MRWEQLEKGPKGEYIEVVDKDEDGIAYDPADLGRLRGTWLRMDSSPRKEIRNSTNKWSTRWP